MLKTIFAAAAIGTLSVAAYAAQDMVKVQTEIPANAMTVCLVVVLADCV